MYEDHEQETLFRELLGISWHKPFECVGTNEEVIFSMWKSYNNEEDKTKLPFILKLFEREVLPKMTDNDFYELGQKMFKNYENNIPDVFLD